MSYDKVLTEHGSCIQKVGLTWDTEETKSSQNL